jgi:hypothetical protein
MVASGRRRNWIDRLVVDGEEFGGREAVGGTAARYFRDLLGGNGGEGGDG